MTNTTDASTIAPGLTNRVEGMFWEIVVADINFAMSCMLQNVFNSWFQTNNIDSQSVDFGTNCLILADKIYEFATTLVD